MNKTIYDSYQPCRNQYSVVVLHEFCLGSFVCHSSQEAPSRHVPRASSHHRLRLRRNKRHWQQQQQRREVQMPMRRWRDGSSVGWMEQELHKDGKQLMTRSSSVEQLRRLRGLDGRERTRVQCCWKNSSWCGCDGGMADWMAFIMSCVELFSFLRCFLARANVMVMWVSETSSAPYK